MRSDTLVRVLKLQRLLDGRRYAPTLRVLAKMFGVHPRTIRRDLMALEEAGWPVPGWRLRDKDWPD